MSVKLRVKKLSSGKKSLYLDIYHNGERSYEFLGIYLQPSAKDNKEKKKLAENIRSKWELELAHSGHGFVPKHKRKINFIDYWGAFIDSYKRKDIRMFNASLNKFEQFLFSVLNKKSIQANMITDKVCKGFKDFLVHDANLTGETPSDYFARFKRVLASAKEDGLFSSNPAEGITLGRGSQNLKKQVLTIGEVRLLNSTACKRPDIKRAFLFSCFTGLGVAELKKLTWKNISERKLKILRSKLEKKGMSIELDLKQGVLDLLGERGEDADNIFHLPSTNTINKYIKQWTNDAGINKHITSYSGRHTFAVMLLVESKTNLKTVADLMAHRSTKHTLKYLHYTDQLKEEAMDNLPDL